MIPPHQGVVLSALTGSAVPVFVIRDAPHNPMHHNRGRDCATAVRAALRQATVPSTPLPPPVYDASDSASERLNRLERLNRNYRCCFSKVTTQCEVEDMYDELLGICANAASAHDMSTATAAAAVTAYRAYHIIEDDRAPATSQPPPVISRLKHPRVYLVEGTDVNEVQVQVQVQRTASVSHLTESMAITPSYPQAQQCAYTSSDSETPIVRNFILPAMEKYFQ
jgi:hypothetical protein